MKFFSTSKIYELGDKTTPSGMFSALDPHPPVRLIRHRRNLDR